MGTPFFGTTGVTAKYYEAAKRGRLFFACNIAIVVNTVISGTATGLIITNPITSGVNLVLLELCIAIMSAPAAQSSLALVGTLLTTASANTTHTTPLVVKNAIIGSGTGFAAANALVDSSATIPTPLPLRAIGGGPAATGSVNTAYIRENIDGSIIMAPGTVISLQAITTAISSMNSILFEEVPA